MKIKETQESEENTLIRQAVGGDRNAFAMLIEKHYDRIYAIAWKFSGSPEDAKDIAQNVVIKLAKTLKSYRFEAAFTTWLYRLTANATKDYLRSKNRTSGRELPIKEEIIAVVEETQDKKLELKDLLAEIDKLPETQKEAIILVCWDGLSHKEAADVLECAETTISWRIHEARKQLSKSLRGSG